VGARTSEVDRDAAGAVPRAVVARAERLHRSSDVRAAFASRPMVGTSLLVVHARRRADGGAPRATVVAGKKVGNAVARNRVKRRLRAALRLTELPTGWDVVVVGRPAVAVAPFVDLCRELDTAMTTVVRRS
jgi:ribonuclease P protein component